METISLLHRSRQKEYKAEEHPRVLRRIPHINFDEVDRLEFLSMISLKSLLWALIFFLFFLDLWIRRSPENWFFSSIAAMSAGFGILALIFTERQYYILIRMNDGAKTKIEITKDNKFTAEYFVDMVNSEMELNN